MDVELRHLRALVAVADELNFTRAAERLHLTQQALSSQIRQLEARVGTRLVDRDTRRVAMTAAGAELVERARPLLAGATDAVTAARAAGVERPRLTIGVVAPIVMRFTAPAMERYAERRPDVDVSVHFGSFTDPWGGLRDASADVAIVYGQFEDAGLERHFLFSEPRGLVVSQRHPLAAKEVVTIEEVLELPIVDVPVTDTVMRDYWTLGRERGGRPMRLGAQVQTLDGIMEAVGAGLGVALTTESAVAALGASAGITFRPVPGVDPLDFSVAHRAGDDRQTVLDFVRAALDMDVSLPWAPPAANGAGEG